MKILIVTQRYWPESFRITDIAETLVKQGNDVTVLTGLPNYPQGYIYDGYKHHKNRIEEHNGVKIIRAKEIARRNNVLFRFFNYYSFPHYAKRIVKKLDKDFDVVLINELSPIMGAKPGLLYKKNYGTKVVMYEMDLWPESLLAGGIKKDSFLYKHYKKVSSKIYSKCDKILVSTKEHINYIKALPECEKLDINYLPQYAEEIFEQVKPKETKDGEIINLMFAGNIGKAQSVDTIIRAAALLKDDKRFEFHIVGSGSEYDNVVTLSKQLDTSNVKFYGQKPVSEMPELYSKMDVMIVTLEDSSYANLTIPGKIQSYLAAGKPIIGAINGSTAEFIKEYQVGKVCSAGDFNGFANIFSNLDSNFINEASMKSKVLYNSMFKKDKFIWYVISTFFSLVMPNCCA